MSAFDWYQFYGALCLRSGYYPGLSEARLEKMTQEVTWRFARWQACNFCLTTLLLLLIGGSQLQSDHIIPTNT